LYSARTSKCNRYNLTTWGERGEEKKIEGGRRGGKEKKREHPHVSLALSPFLSLPLSNERMHERLLQTVESGERVLPWGSLFRAIDFHLLPSAHPTPLATVSEGERGIERWRWNESEIDGWLFSLASFLSLFLSLP